MPVYCSARKDAKSHAVLSKGHAKLSGSMMFPKGVGIGNAAGSLCLGGRVDKNFLLGIG